MTAKRAKTPIALKDVGGWGFGFWVLGFGFWVLGFGFWVLGFGFRVLGFGFRVWGLWSASSPDGQHADEEARDVNCERFRV